MSDAHQHDVVIIGAGIGGLTFALALEQVGIRARLYEAAPELLPLGVGLNLLPHAVRVLSSLGLEERLVAAGIPTQEYVFYTRAGQLVYTEPRGLHAGYDWPQVSIHRGDLHAVLLAAVTERLGPDAIRLNHKCVEVEQDDSQVIARFEDGGEARGSVLIACDGVHSVARALFHPTAAVPRYEGTTQYRGVTRWPRFLTGASMAYLGTNARGKLVVYPIRDDIDGKGTQLINWVIELEEADKHINRDWTRKAKVEDFIAGFENCAFDWLDIPAMLRAADEIYEYPMVDQDPLSFWSRGRISLLGDAAHPMMPRGSNGAAQAIIDAVTLAGLLAGAADASAALKAYEAERLPATSSVVIANRGMSPDAILNVIEERTEGLPFDRIEDVISHDELVDWQERYKAVAGFAASSLRKDEAVAP